MTLQLKLMKHQKSGKPCTKFAKYSIQQFAPYPVTTLPTLLCTCSILVAKAAIPAQHSCLPPAATNALGWGSKLSAERSSYC